MSVIDNKQALEPAIDKIIEGIKMFSSAVDEREECGEWKPKHIDEICEIDVQLHQIKRDLVRIKLETW
jgi:hypothetical protein